jgi:hypothetical protein
MGLVQHEGGPCGVLATVQVYDIPSFSYGSNSPVAHEIVDQCNLGS